MCKLDDDILILLAAAKAETEYLTGFAVEESDVSKERNFKSGLLCSDAATALPLSILQRTVYRQASHHSN